MYNSICIYFDILCICMYLNKEIKQVREQFFHFANSHNRTVCAEIRWMYENVLTEWIEGNLTSYRIK